MSAQVKEHVALSDLNEPILISAFTSSQPGGATATSALAYLMSQWDGRLVAELEPDDYYNYARLRPSLRQVDSKAVVDWPTSQIYQVTPPDADRDVLVLLGLEPSMRWRSFVRELADYMGRLGVTSAISMRSLPAAVSHRSPTPLQAVYSDEAASEGFDIPASVFTEGALDIGALLNLELRERGVQTVDLLALEPYYTTGLPDAKAGLALLETIGAALNLQIPSQALRQAIDAQLAATESAIASSAEVEAVVRSLEERSHAVATHPRQLELPQTETTDSDLNAEAALNEVEALLFGRGDVA